jgi:hypothetical protein
MSESAPSKKLLWTGWLLSAIPALMLLSGGINALLKVPMVVQGTARAGYDASSLLPIGLLEIVCTLLFLVPRTAFFGAVLLTAYFGGATATHVRIHESIWFVPVLFGVLTWVALTLRDPRLRAYLLP